MCVCPTIYAQFIYDDSGFLGGIFNRRERKLSRSDEGGSGMINATATVAIAVAVPTNSERSTDVWIAWLA